MWYSGREDRTLKKVSWEEGRRFRGLEEGRGLGGKQQASGEWETLRKGGAKRGPRAGGPRDGVITLELIWKGNGLRLVRAVG